MIIFNLAFFNNLLALIGVIGWVWVWCFTKYKTGHDARIQSGVIAFGILWIVLFLADSLQHVQPTSLTIFGRAVIIYGLWSCMPLLENKRKKP